VFCSDARATPYVVAVVPEVQEKSESFIDNFPFVEIPIPSSRQSVKPVISVIGFHWPVKTGKEKSCSTTGLLAIPLPLPNSCHPKPSVEAGKANVSSKCREARWLGPDLVPSSRILETREIIDDQNKQGLSPQKVKSEEEDDQECIDLNDEHDEDEVQDHETNHADRYLTEERDFEKHRLKEIESALRSLDGCSMRAFTP
jgi:hypothetical protein